MLITKQDIGGFGYFYLQMRIFKMSFDEVKQTLLTMKNFKKNKLYVFMKVSRYLDV